MLIKENFIKIGLDNIKTIDMRRFFLTGINLAPNEFYTKPASSTSKYHPDICNSRNGLAIHSVLVMEIAKKILDVGINEFINSPYNSSFNIIDNYTPYQKQIAAHIALYPPENTQIYRDMILSACLLHDVAKYRLTAYHGYYYAKHALEAYEALLQLNPMEISMESIKYIRQAIDCVLTHHGEYNFTSHHHTKRYGRLPNNTAEYIVHLADYTASLKHIRIDNDSDINKLFNK